MDDLDQKIAALPRGERGFARRVALIDRDRGGWNMHIHCQIRYMPRHCAMRTKWAADIRPMLERARMKRREMP